MNWLKKLFGQKEEKKEENMAPQEAPQETPEAPQEEVGDDNIQ